jgi:hypothetical protein
MFYPTPFSLPTVPPNPLLSNRLSIVSSGETQILIPNARGLNPSVDESDQSQTSVIHVVQEKRNDGGDVEKAE